MEIDLGRLGFAVDARGSDDGPPVVLSRLLLELLRASVMRDGVFGR